MPSIYLASPLGFAESTRPFMHDLSARLRQHVVVHNPWDEVSFTAQINEVMAIDSVTARDAQLAAINYRIGQVNRETIDKSDGLFAVLDGVDVDSGTAAEIGYAFAKGKYINGLRTDFRLAADNYGSIVNLQVEYFIRESGGRIATTTDDMISLARQFASGQYSESR